MSSAEETEMAMQGSRPAQSSLKDEIVRVACELGTELGEDGLTMRGIASRLGVSATALYQHFEGKASILRAIRFHGMAQINRVLESCFEHSDPVECIASVSRTYIQFARDNPWLYGVLFTGEGLDYSALTDAESKLIFHSHKKTQACFEAARDAGQFRSDLDLEMAPLFLWSSNHGAATLLLNGRIGTGRGAMNVDDTAFVAQFVDNCVRGFRPD